jgi:hypothetical protein
MAVLAVRILPRMTTPAEQLAAEALKAQSVSNDGVTVSRRSLTELMEYEKHVAGKTAASASPNSMLKSMVSKIVPPGGH